MKFTGNNLLTKSILEFEKLLKKTTNRVEKIEINRTLQSLHKGLDTLL